MAGLVAADYGSDDDDYEGEQNVPTKAAPAAASSSISNVNLTDGSVDVDDVDDAVLESLLAKERAKLRVSSSSPSSTAATEMKTSGSLFSDFQTPTFQNKPASFLGSLPAPKTVASAPRFQISSLPPPSSTQTTAAAALLLSKKRKQDKEKEKKSKKHKSRKDKEKSSKKKHKHDKRESQDEEDTVTSSSAVESKGSALPSASSAPALPRTRINAAPFASDVAQALLAVRAGDIADSDEHTADPSSSATAAEPAPSTAHPLDMDAPEETLPIFTPQPAPPPSLPPPPPGIKRRVIAGVNAIPDSSLLTTTTRAISKQDSATLTAAAQAQAAEIAAQAATSNMPQMPSPSENPNEYAAAYGADSAAYPEFDYSGEAKPEMSAEYAELAQLDPTLARRLGSTQVKIIDINAAELTKKTLKEELEAKFQEDQPRMGAVKATFWNASQGSATTVFAPGKLQNRKHQINSLAYAAQKIEVEAAKKKAAGYQARQMSRAKYGW